MSFLDTVKEKMASYKMRILAVTTVSLVTLVQYAQAVSLNESIGPILTSVTELFVPLLALVIAAVPIIIAIAIIGFILGILSAILGAIKI
jgi:hypothetical protein